MNWKRTGGIDNFRCNFLAVAVESSGRVLPVLTNGLQACLLVDVSPVDGVGYHPDELLRRLEVIELGTGVKVLVAVDHDERHGSNAA